MKMIWLAEVVVRSRLPQKPPLKRIGYFVVDLEDPATDGNNET